MSTISDIVRIAVVGNAVPDRNYSEQIDAADRVVRFNACSHYRAGKTGHRTNILCVRSFGDIGHKFAQGSTPLESRVVEACETFWFVGEAGNWAPAIARRYRLESRQQTLFTLEQMQSVDRQLNRFGSHSHQGASLGVMAVAFLLEAFPAARLELFCFGFDGWQGHPWTQEKRFVMFHQYLGVLDCAVLPDLASLVPVVAEASPGSGRITASVSVGFNLNDTGAYIIGKLGRRLTFAQLCAEVRAELADAPDSLELDVATFLWSLEDRGVLDWEES